MTKKIELTRDQVTIVDDELYKWLNQWNWCAWKPGHVFYAVRNVVVDDGKKEMVYMHRQILGLVKGDGKLADHINRDGLDNRQSNLRVVNSTGNLRNHRQRSDNISGYNGVHWEKRRNKWLVGIGVSGKWIHLGRYNNLKDAVMSRKQGEAKYWQTLLPNPPPP